MNKILISRKQIVNDLSDEEIMRLNIGINEHKIWQKAGGMIFIYTLISGYLFINFDVIIFLIGMIFLACGIIIRLFFDHEILSYLFISITTLYYGLVVLAQYEEMKFWFLVLIIVSSNVLNYKYRCHEIKSQKSKNKSSQIVLPISLFFTYIILRQSDNFINLFLCVALYFVIIAVNGTFFNHNYKDLVTKEFKRRDLEAVGVK